MKNGMAFKEYLILGCPSPDDTQADRERILAALGILGYDRVSMSLSALRQLYPLVSRAGYKVTVTLAVCEQALEIIRVEPGDTTDSLYGLALDIGSTTLELELIDMKTGKALANTGCANSQRAFGLNILDRIIAVKERRENLDRLRELVIGDINTLIESACAESGIGRDEICAMTVGGNTTMIHFFTGCDPWLVFQNPYTPAFYNPGIFSAGELGLKLDCRVTCLPAVANYLGGDITAGLLLTDIDRDEKTSLFLDIGTNGELALGNSSFLLVGAGAAGPALEGFGSRFGMRYSDGAVCGVHIDDNNEMQLRVVGDTEPVGICGTGIFDLIAECYLCDWIDGAGNVNSRASEHCIEVWSEDKQLMVPAVEFYRSGDNSLYFTEDDIKEFMKCKAAAFTMVATLLDYCGFSLENVDRFYLSGGFGTNINLESAITVGIYPDIPREKFVILGNSSLQGAEALLLDRTNWDRVKQFVEKAVYLQFGEMEKFLENMVAAEFLPHTNGSLYPSVKKRRTYRG